MNARTLAGILLLWLYPASAEAGLSLVLTPGSTTNSVVDPALPSNQSWRAEFQLHDWTVPATGSAYPILWDFAGIGASASLVTVGGGYLRFLDEKDTLSGSVCDIPIVGRNNILVRVQRDLSAMRFVCEIWNTDGSGYAQYALNILTAGTSASSGARIGGSNTNARLGFLRFLGTIVPDGSRPPTTFTAEPTITNFKFDGDAVDSSGNGHNATFPGASFAQTPTQVPTAIARTDDAPAWSNWISQRAGFPATLNATQSYSMADASDQVTYTWQQLAGPTTLRWSDRKAARPVVRGLIFGTYKIRLMVTDAANLSTTTDLEFGSVATDDKGVVVHANPAADLLFGPMIAFGKNQWPWADYTALHSAQVRRNTYNTISPPGWGVNLAGTVSYIAASPTQPALTSITSPLAAADMTISVADAKKLDFSELPTVLMIHTGNNIFEEVQVCSVSGNVLTVCYDGRAFRAGLYERVPAPQAWPVGTSVRQIATIGTGTKFLTDFCGAGPGEAGLPLNLAGKVSMTPGSTTVTGTGTAWDGTLVSTRIRIQGTHGGAPFVFFSTVQAVNSPTSITVSRVWPADADPGTGLSYAVLQQGRSIVRGWVRPDGTQGQFLSTISACESDTRMYHTDWYTAISQPQTNQNIGWELGSWFAEYGPNYYDEVLAHYAGYMRSGYTFFRDNARMIGDYLPTSPDYDEGWIGIFPRRVGLTGMVAAAVLDGRTSNWYAIRKTAAGAVGFAGTGGAVISSCDTDIREDAYGLSWIALAALFDPVDTGEPNTPNQRSYWKAQLDKALIRDRACKGPNYEFPQPYWGGSGAYNMTTGSTTVTGSNPGASMCAAAGTGTINVTNGVHSATGTGFAPNTKIVVKGLRNGQPYLFYSYFTVNSPTAITMASPYDGDSGTYPYQIETDTYWLAFAKDYTDHATMNVLYTCQWIDNNTIQLDRPWQGQTGVFQSYRYLELGYGQEPFLAGIKTFAMKLASLASTGETSVGYAQLAAGTANWILSSGFDPLTGGLNYAREWPGCEPKLNPRLNCMYSNAPGSYDIQSARFLNAEAQNALRVAYEANPTPQNLAFGDQFYGAQWGKLGGPYADGVYLTALDSDAIWNFKWLGFLFGIGMAHQWPAVRLGGVSPAVPVSPSIAFNLGSAPGAVSAQIAVTQPNGATSTYACASSPCVVGADARQGAHIYRINYLNAAGAILSSSEPEILEVR
jgi:hypothetical protein